MRYTCEYSIDNSEKRLNIEHEEEKSNSSIYSLCSGDD